MEIAKFDSVDKTRFNNVTWVAEIPSTNTALLERARSGGQEGEVIIADLQTQGRGRRGREWTAPAGTSLMMSMLLRPPSDALSPSNASLATSALALSARTAILELTNVNLEIKWPNDLVIDTPVDQLLDADLGYRKVAGILTETLISNAVIEALVIGIGLNTGWGEVPPELQSVATSLDVLTKSEIDRNALGFKILQNFETEYAALLAPNGSQQVLHEVKKHSNTLGKRVQVHMDVTANTQIIRGLAVDLDECGRLIVETGDNDSQIITMGDVEHLRLDTR